MRRLSLVIILACFVVACNKKEERKNDLQYETKTFRVESEGGCKSDTTRCASYEVVYPSFQGLSKTVSDTLYNRMVESIDTGNPEIESHTFEEAGKLFIDDFNQAQKEFPDNTMGWYFKATVKVNLLADTLVSLESTAEFFTGGAHGGYGTYFINARPSSGQPVLLKDVFRPGFEEELRSMAEKEFRKKLNLTDSSSLAEEGFEFPGDEFALNDNYGFTNKGITFVFNIYEIAPYVLGAQEILIPYEEIRELLK
jgi:hypothetical protein